MNLSYDWLRELCEVATFPAPRELAARLTMAGLAVDAVHEAGDDFVLEFDLTSNRPDCLSHLGMARETVVLTGGRVSLPEAAPERVEGRAGDLAAVEIQEPLLCPRYTARIVRGVRIAPSPAWLANRLQAIGQRPINNVADITNYVLHELGQPIHAFDLATLEGSKIIVRRARVGEKLKTLDGVVRELDEEMLVIADATRAVALAGVMGGEETEVTAATRDVLIESAYFEPSSVRRTARVLGLHTEASYRFERGVDYEGAVRASARAAALMSELAGGVATEDVIDVSFKRPEPSVVNLRFARIKGLTGLDVPAPEAMQILTALGFELRTNGQGQTASASFVAPTWRIDVEREEDLVEEVARHAGYEKIGEALPAGNVVGEYRVGDTRRRAARRALTAQGFDEAVSFSFIEAAHDGQFELLPGLFTVEESGAANENISREQDLARSHLKAPAVNGLVTLSNPIIEGVTRMRPTLLPGLLGAVRHNFNHGTRHVRLFEVGRVFGAQHEPGARPHERESLAWVMTGGAVEEGRAGAPREVDFYDLKGALEAAVEAMKIGARDYRAASVRHLREGQAAEFFMEGKKIGTLGRLSEEISAAYKFRQPIFVAEIDFSALLAAPAEIVRYAPLARYPSVMRDVSLLVDRRVTLADLQRAALEQDVKEVREVALVDVFEGAHVPEGERSITLRIEYRADERTLRDEEVEALHQHIIGALREKFGAQMRR